MKKNIAIAKIIFPVSLVKCHRIGKRRCNINMQILSGPIYTVFKNTPNKTIKKKIAYCLDRTHDPAIASLVIH